MVEEKKAESEPLTEGWVKVYAPNEKFSHWQPEPEPVTSKPLGKSQGQGNGPKKPGSDGPL